MWLLFCSAVTWQVAENTLLFVGIYSALIITSFLCQFYPAAAIEFPIESLILDPVTLFLLNTSL